jgi:TRAP-type C4-dicarboxylate transport system permease small subunit
MIFFLWLIIVGLIIVLPFWKIFSKAGFSGVLSILMIIPIVNLFMIFYLAFAEWPALKNRPGGTPQQPPPMG